MILLIGNLPRHISHDQLCTYFEAYGIVYDIYMPVVMKRCSPYFGSNKGHAFITIQDAPYLYYLSSIERPLYLNDILLVSVTIVNKDTPPSHKSDPVLLQEIRRIQIQKHMK
jgi:RNA recognition motif-containing protein